MVEKILLNPYEVERNFFVLKCKQLIPYLGALTDNELKKLYHKSERGFYEVD